MQPTNVIPMTPKATVRVTCAIDRELMQRAIALRIDVQELWRRHLAATVEVMSMNLTAYEQEEFERGLQEEKMKKLGLNEGTKDSFFEAMSKRVRQSVSRAGAEE